MPAILQVGRYRFYFFSNEGREPAHIHAKADQDQAKFWLEPIELATNHGFKAYELNEIKSIIEENEKLLIEAWYEHFRKN